MHRILPWIVIVALALLRPALAIDRAYFEAVGDAESIPDGVVTALAEDRTGFLWIGTTAGLIRYDGYRLRHYVHDRNDPQSLGGNLIRALHVGGDGRLWIGTDADGLSAYDPDSGRFTVWRHDENDPDSPGEGAITAIAEDPAGHLWIAVRGSGVERFDPESGRFMRLPATAAAPRVTPDDRVTALLFDRSGTLWVGSWSGLSRLRGGRLEPVVLHGDAAGPTVYSLFEASDGRVWIGTRSGALMQLEPSTGAVRVIEPADPARAGGGAAIAAFAEPSAGRVWVGRANGIEVRDADGDRLRQLLHDPQVRSSLAANDVRALLVDQSGLLWVGGFGGGLQRHDPGNRAIAVLRQQPGHGGVLEEPSIASVRQLADGRIWLGTRGHGIAILDAQLQLLGSHLPQPDTPGALQVGWITAITQTADGTVWLGTRVGLQRFDPTTERFEMFQRAYGLRAPGSLSVRCLLADPAGWLWIGTGDGVYRMHVGPAGGVGPIERIALDDGEALAGDINALARDAAGTVWIGGARGLFRLPADAVAAEPVATEADHGMGHPSVVGLLVDRDDRLWIDTVDGLYRLLDGHTRPARFDAVSERLGIAGGDFGANLLQDDSGRIWTHRYMYDPAQDRLHPLHRSDGVDFGTGWFRAHARTADGRLLFGGSQGLLVIEPQRFRPWSFLPPVAVTELRVQGRPAPLPPDGLRLPPQARSFSIEFAALDYSAPERNLYRYRLAGFDDDWIATDASRRVATYSNLWPGDYRLQVQGSNRLGLFGEQALEIPIRVLPAWWQTTWFLLLAIAAALAAVYAAIQLRTERIQRRARTLERLVDERTAALSQAVQRTEHALQDLRGAQNQLVVAEKMASLGQLVAGVAHEINTPIGIAVTAASHLQETTRDSSHRLAAGTLTRSELARWQQVVEEGSGLILGSLQRAHALIGGFKRVAVDQSSEQRRRFDLREFLAEVRLALQPSYRRLPHTLEIECADGIGLDTYPGALFQIITNLVTNALTHAFAGDTPGHMRIVVEPLGTDRIRLRFRDDGAGMPSHVAARAFDPFFTTRRGSGGSGLGLHLVYNLATRLLGGSVALHSEPGAGSEFVFDLPRTAPVRMEADTRVAAD